MSGSCLNVGDRVEWWFAHGGPRTRGYVDSIKEYDSPWGPVYFYGFRDGVTGKLADETVEGLCFRPLCLLDELAEVADERESRWSKGATADSGYEQCMGYDILIGNAELAEPDDPEDRDGLYEASFYVRGVTHPEAPVFENDTMTGKSNGRYPGYGAWADFLRSVELHDLFKNERTGLMRQHPGCHMLAPDHGEKISQALAAYRKKYPNAKPGFGEEILVNSPVIVSDVRSMDVPDRQVANFHMARLIWLDWWVQWALKNCERPAIYNR